MPTFRFHKGSIEDSLKTSIVVKSKKELAESISNFNHASGLYNEINPSVSIGHYVDEKDLKIIPYVFDSRIGWNTHLVIEKGRCTQEAFIVGFLSDGFDI